MLNGHLSDEQIQELAQNGTTAANEAMAHADTCAACKIKIENYRLLMHAIDAQPAHAFDFDLAELVVAQIETSPPKQSMNGLWWLFIIPMIAIITGVAIYLGGYMTVVFEGIKSLATVFMVISGLVLVVALVIAQYKTYQTKMKMLDMP